MWQEMENFINSMENLHAGKVQKIKNITLTNTLPLTGASVSKGYVHEQCQYFKHSFIARYGTPMGMFFKPNILLFF
ncbi:hypothetical protein KHP59_08065 [Virgibacillus sp. 19R1-5]|nr:hypothetical protein [Virgibacillus sp. 19R1-5]